MFDLKNLHHAYVIEGERSSALESLKNFLEKELKISTQGNPDFYLSEHNSFGITEARALKEREQQMAIGGGKKIFVICANSFTREAQNSLLKIFEEPTADTHFFIIMPRAERLLPTLRSRVMMVKAGQAGGLTKNIEGFSIALRFLKASKPERMRIVKEMVAELEEEKITKADIVSFLNEVERSKHQEGLSSKTPEEDLMSLEQMIKMRGYLEDQSSSAKLILEYLALTLS